MGFTSLGHPASVWYKYRWPHYMVRWLETWWRQLWWRGPVVHPPPSITSLLLQISTLWEKKTIQPEERWFSQYFIIENKKGNLSSGQARLQWISYIWVGVFTNDNPSSIIITGPCCADVSHYGDKDVAVWWAVSLSSSDTLPHCHPACLSVGHRRLKPFEVRA